MKFLPLIFAAFIIYSYTICASSNCIRKHRDHGSKCWDDDDDYHGSWHKHDGCRDNWWRPKRHHEREPYKHWDHDYEHHGHSNHGHWNKWGHKDCSCW